MSEAQAAAALLAGAVVEGLTIERVLEQGRFSTAYLVREGAQIWVLREFLPVAYTLREGLAVQARESEDRNALRWWMRSFVDQAQALGRLRHPALPIVQRVFEANNTAYAVTEPVAGETLAAMLEREGTVDEARLRRILNTLLDGLERAHAAGLLHRDIRPQNVMVRPDGSAILVDFAVLRAAVRFKSGLLSGAGVAPYAAPEERTANATPGAWTDLYGLGALAYRAICGIDPPSAQQRAAGTALLPTAQAARVRASSAMLEAVDRALILAPSMRPQSVADWRALLRAESASAAAFPTVAAPASKSAGKGLRLALPLLLIALVGAGYWAFTRIPTGPAGTAAATATATAPASVAVASSAADAASNPTPSSSNPTTGEVKPSSLDRLALDLMARDKKSQDAAREQQRQEELLAKQKQDAAKAAAAAGGTAGTTTGGNARPTGQETATKPAAKTDSASRAPAVTVPAESAPAVAPASQDEAMRNELERLRAELKARQSPESAKTASAVGCGSAAYCESINGLIASQLRYPKVSQANLEEGNEMVRVRVQRNGTVMSATVIQKSDYSALDQEAARVFSRIGRFPPVPVDIAPGSSEIEFTLPIRFKLGEK